jgi:hypothetical protein
MDVWMYGCMNVWMDGCMDGWMDGWIEMVEMIKMVCKIDEIIIH